MTSALPMLRAVKDADELERLAAAGAAADASFEQIRQVRFAGRPESEVAAELAGFSASMAIRRSTSPSSARPERRQPPPRVRRACDRGRRHGRARLRRDQGRLRLRHDPHRSRRRADRRGTRGLRDRPASAAGGLRGSAAGRRVPGDRPSGAACDRRRRVRRAVHPPDGARHRPHDARAAVHDRGRPESARAGMCFSIEPGIYLSENSASGSRTSSRSPRRRRRFNNTPHELQIVA